ncbi:MAG: hypothetical protein HY313_00055 [Acidobacteria bacterium]|nr:hypothetical protein [Acidobacteriota bacterium]
MIPGKPALDLNLYITVVPLRGRARLHVRRQQVDDNLSDVIEKALRTKVPKLVNTVAVKRILLLERQHWNLHPKSILDEIEGRRAAFPDLAKVDEIWIVETFFYGTAFGSSNLYFERWENGTCVESLDVEG